MHIQRLWLQHAQHALLPPLAAPPTATHCPTCQSPHPHRWGTRTRGVHDLTGYQTVVVQRDRCRACRRTWSVKPDGVDRTRHTVRLQPWHGGLWARGSAVQAVCWLERFGWGWACRRMAIGRDIRRQASGLA